MIIYNHTQYWREEHGGPPAYKILVKMYPVGAFFNGQKLYSPNGITTVGGPFSEKITGGEIVLDTLTDLNATPVRKRFLKINFDDQVPTSESECDLNIGMALYRIEFWNPNRLELYNYVYIDWRDGEFRDVDNPLGANELDIRIDYFSSDSITFRHYPYNINYPHYFYYIYNVNKNIKMWELHGTFLPQLPYSKGLFKSDPSNNGEFLNWPINANSYNDNTGHESPGEIGLNLRDDHDAYTKDVLISNPTNIVVTKKSALIIDNSKIFNMITPSSPSGGYNNLIIQDSAYLILYNNSQIIVNSPNKITLKPQSNLHLTLNFRLSPE